MEAAEAKAETKVETKGSDRAVHSMYTCFTSVVWVAVDSFAPSDEIRANAQTGVLQDVVTDGVRNRGVGALRSPPTGASSRTFING